MDIVSPELELQIRAAHRVVPSNINPWFGTWWEGQRFTGQQLRGLDEHEIDPATVETIDVFVSVSRMELWVPSDRKMLWRRVLCPVIGRRGDRLTVLSPRGYRKLVYPDGFLFKRKHPVQ